MLPVGKILADIGEGCWLLTLVGGWGGGVPVGKVLAGIGEGCCLLVRYLLTLARGVGY